MRFLPATQSLPARSVPRLYKPKYESVSALGPASRTCGGRFRPNSMIPGGPYSNNWYVVPSPRAPRPLPLPLPLSPRLPSRRRSGTRSGKPPRNAMRDDAHCCTSKLILSRANNGETRPSGCAQCSDNISTTGLCFRNHHFVQSQSRRRESQVKMPDNGRLCQC